MHSRRMFEGYSVTLPPVSETKGNPEPRELLDDDATTEPCSEVRRASTPPAQPSAAAETTPPPPSAGSRPEAPSPAAGKGQTLGFEPAEGESRKVTPVVAFEAMTSAARSMKASRPTPLGLGAAGTPQPSKPPEFYAAETAPFEPVDSAATKPTLTPAAGTRSSTPVPVAAAPSEGTREVELVVRLSETLLKGRPAYVTLTLPTGEVLFEGDAVADGAGGARADVHAVVPCSVAQVKALAEAGGTYRTAMVPLVEDGLTEYTFA